jgi:putative sterol carrier protein
MPLTIEELMSRMPAAFIPEKAQGVDAIIQFKFTGAEASDWHVAIKDGACQVMKGVTSLQPNMTLTADSGDFIKLITGELDPMQAFMQGKLKLQGDLNLAMKLTQMFKVRSQP